MKAIIRTPRDILRAHLNVTERVGQRGDGFKDARQQHDAQIARHSAVARFLCIGSIHTVGGDGSITTAGAKAVTVARRGAFMARTS